MRVFHIKRSWAWAVLTALAVAAGAAPRARAANVALGGDPVKALLTGANICLRGPSAACCGLLDGVLGDPDNPLTRCMCIADAINALQREGMSLAATVASCQGAGRPMAGAAGFLGRHAATCAAGAAGAPTTDRARAAAEVAPLLQALGPPGRRWAAANIEQGLVGGAAGEGVSRLLRGLSYNALIWVPIAGGAVFALTIAVHLAAALCCGARLAAMGLEQRLVLTQHALFALVYALQLVPYTWMAAIFLFRRWTAEYLVGNDQHACQLGVLIGLFIVSHAFMYCLESGTRALVEPSPLLLLHHALFYVLLACGIFLGPSMLLIKVTIILDLGDVHELPLYLGLLAYRLWTSPRGTRAVLAAGMVWYGATRATQTALLVWLLAVCDPSLRRGAPFVISAAVAVGLVGVQAYTLVVCAGMYKRAGGNRTPRPSASSLDSLKGPSQPKLQCGAAHAHAAPAHADASVTVVQLS